MSVRSGSQGTQRPASIPLPPLLSFASVLLAKGRRKPFSFAERAEEKSLRSKSCPGHSASSVPSATYRTCDGPKVGKSVIYSKI